jgi:PKD repeat protein
MRRPRVTPVLAILGAIQIWLISPNVAAQPSTGPEEFYVVGFHALPRGLAQGHDFLGADVRRVDHALHFIRVATNNANLFRARARGDRRVRYIEPDPEIQLIDFIPNDPRFGSQQYGPQHVRAPEAWDSTLGDMDASVCVVDTGVRYTHEDIVGPRWLGGTDLYNGDADPMDDHGHGTHVAGIAAATINNGKGIAGIGNVGIRGVKVLSNTGSGALSTIASGIRWCADNAGPRVVINMSLGSPAGSTPLLDAVQYAYGAGALMAAAAGNSGPCTNCIEYPAKYTEVIPVTCTTASATQCSFSSDGPESELTAPGNLVTSLWRTSDTAYNSISGTSMSTPHVSGVAALVWSQATTLANTALRDHLRSNAQDLGVAGRDELYGFGLVDARKTIDAVSLPPSPETTISIENFDDGVADGWTNTGLWHVSSACSTPPSTPSYLGYQEDSDCEYSTGARTSGTATFDANLAGKTTGTLTFTHRFEKESYATSAFDQMKVQVSTNGGTSWTTLRQWDSRNANQLAWTPHSVDLDAYAGAAIKLRFFFDSMDHVANNYDGWFLDNVEVTGGGGNQPPVANAGSDQTVPDDDGSGNESVTLDGSGSTDPDGTIVSYEWLEGVTPTATGATPIVSLGTGSHSITLTVTDDLGGTASDEVIVTVNPNQPPTASFTHSETNLTVNVDATGSGDSDGSVVGYSWNWGDGSPAGSGVTASHTYGAGGIYTVSLAVTDNGGATGSTSQPVEVSPPSETTVSMENFDDGVANGWVLTGLWHVSSACSTPPSLPNYLGFNQDSDCEYSTGSRVLGMATFDVNLAGRTAATLKFAHRFEKESNTVSYDAMRVRVSTDGGTNWTLLRQWDARDPNQLAWNNQSLDLDAFTGGAIKLRFYFDSVNGAANNFDGWLLDDVEVTAL